MDSSDSSPPPEPITTKQQPQPQPQPPWDVALCVSSSLGWIVAGVLLLLPSLYYAVIHLFAIVGFFGVVSSGDARQMGIDIQRNLFQAIVQRVAALLTHAPPHPHPHPQPHLSTASSSTVAGTASSSISVKAGIG